MLSRISCGVVLVATLVTGSLLAIAQGTRTASGPEAGIELVKEWADPVLQWNAVGLAVAASTDPVTQQRILSIAHLAIFEAVNAIEADYQPYLGSIAAPPGASPEAAAIAAAHAVLIELLPAQSSMLESARASSLARIPNGSQKDAGISLGKAAARAMIDHRINDGFELPASYVPSSNEPGAWQLTPGCPPEGGVFLHLGDVKPFGIERGDHFRPDAPPSLTSRRYAKDLNEVKALGALDSPNRPPDRTDVARFYAAVLNLPTWNPAARQIAQGQKRSLSENARAFALLNIAMTDALIAVFDAKYHYTLWRPETAIAGADSDDNPRTEPDAGFKPLITTPCHPSYASAHASAAGAAQRVLERIYGRGPHLIELSSPSVPDVRLQYSSLQEIAGDIDDARIYGGIHYRFDQEAGARLGRRVSSYLLSRHLRPARQRSLDAEDASDSQ
jgi:hypothetical protein